MTVDRQHAAARELRADHRRSRSRAASSRRRSRGTGSSVRSTAGATCRSASGSSRSRRSRERRAHDRPDPGAPRGPVPVLRRPARDRRAHGRVPPRGVHHRVRAARRAAARARITRCMIGHYFARHGRGRAGLLPDLGVPAVPADGGRRVRGPAPAATCARTPATASCGSIPAYWVAFVMHHAVLRDLRCRSPAAAASSSTSSSIHLYDTGSAVVNGAARVPRARRHLAVVDARGRGQLLHLPADLRRAAAPARHAAATATSRLPPRAADARRALRDQRRVARRTCTTARRRARRSRSSATTGCPANLDVFALGMGLAVVRAWADGREERDAAARDDRSPRLAVVAARRARASTRCRSGSACRRSSCSCRAARRTRRRSSTASRRSS